MVALATPKKVSQPTTPQPGKVGVLCELGLYRSTFVKGDDGRFQRVFGTKEALGKVVVVPWANRPITVEDHDHLLPMAKRIEWRMSAGGWDGYVNGHKMLYLTPCG